jgi:uncharacterized membrane protein
MSDNTNSDFQNCLICHCLFEDALLFPFALLREETQYLIKEDHPHIDEEGHICRSDLSQYHTHSVMKRLETRNKTPYKCTDTFGERTADRIAIFGGSWTFIITFFVILMVWIAVNTVFFVNHTFDAYPFILLNLILSCLAAVQAPIILMSQNRQADRDRKQAWHDYEVNLKAEMEVRHLHEKIDHMHRRLDERMNNMETRLK